MFTFLLQFAVAFLVLLYIVAVETIALASSMILSVGDWLCGAVVLLGIIIYLVAVVASAILVATLLCKKPVASPAKKKRVRFVSSDDAVFYVEKGGDHSTARILGGSTAYHKTSYKKAAAEFNAEWEKAAPALGYATAELLWASDTYDDEWVWLYHDVVEEVESTSLTAELSCEWSAPADEETHEDEIDIDIDIKESTTIDALSTIENSSNLLTAAPNQRRRRRRVVSPPPPLRRSARLVSRMTNTTQIVLGSFVSADGQRRSARLSQACRG